MALTGSSDSFLNSAFFPEAIYSYSPSAERREVDLFDPSFNDDALGTVDECCQNSETTLLVI